MSGVLSKLEAYQAMGNGCKIYEPNILPTKNSYFFFDPATDTISVEVPAEYKKKNQEYLNGFNNGVIDAENNRVSLTFSVYEGAVKAVCVNYKCLETDKFGLSDLPNGAKSPTFFAVEGQVIACEVGSVLHQIFVANKVAFRKCEAISEEEASADSL